jgi:hypothetical protein
LKPVFIIAIVAVVMIGLMIPSIFAETIRYEDNYLGFSIEVDDVWNVIDETMTSVTFFGDDGSLGQSLFLVIFNENDPIKNHQDAVKSIRSAMDSVCSEQDCKFLIELPDKNNGITTIDKKVAYQVGYQYKIGSDVCSTIITSIPDVNDSWSMLGIACGKTHSSLFFSLKDSSNSFHLLNRSEFQPTYSDNQSTYLSPSIQVPSSTKDSESKQQWSISNPGETPSEEEVKQALGSIQKSADIQTKKNLEIKIAKLEAELADKQVKNVEQAEQITWAGAPNAEKAKYSGSMFDDAKKTSSNVYQNQDYNFMISYPDGWFIEDNPELMVDGSGLVGFSKNTSSSYPPIFGVIFMSLTKSDMSEMEFLSDDNFKETISEGLVVDLDNPRILNMNLKRYSDGVVINIVFVHTVRLSDLTDSSGDSETFVTIKQNSIAYLLKTGDVYFVNFSALSDEFNSAHNEFKYSLKSFIAGSSYPKTSYDSLSSNLSESERITWDGAPGMSQLSPKLDQSTTSDSAPEEKSSEGGGCLIATATYGSELAPQVQQLRELRDNQLLNTESGTAFMSTFNDIYYSFSPVIADYERENPLFKEVVKLAITPMISSLSLMENANSESEVLGLGLSVIMLNIGMYLGVPAMVVIGIRKRI